MARRSQRRGRRRRLLGKIANPILPALVAATLSHRDGQCRWPVGDIAAPDFRFCRRRAVDHHVYCGRHGGGARLSTGDRPDVTAAGRVHHLLGLIAEDVDG